jgi:uncharacterized membrane protein
MQKNVNDVERAVSIAAGAALLALAAWKKLPRTAANLAGLGLVARGASGLCPVNAALGRTRTRDNTKEALSGSRGIRLDDGVTINASPEALYTFWRDLTNLPRFMDHIDRIDVIDDTHSHWVIAGPANLKVEWDAAIINEVPGELIGWQSLPGSDVASAGSVHFKPLAGGGTHVEVSLQYDPPAGKLGASLAWLTGRGASTMLRDDLRRLKELVETGDSQRYEAMPNRTADGVGSI